MAADKGDATTRPDIMDSLTGSQLKELELRYDDNDRAEFTRIAASYNWTQEAIDEAWNWLSAGRRREGFEE